MARIVDRLKPAQIKNLREGLHLDGAGLYLKVDPSGSRSWVFRFRSPITNKERRMGLGSFLNVSLAKAREKALSCRDLLDSKRDPIDERDREHLERIKKAKEQKLQESQTFKWCAEQYISIHEPAWTNKKHGSQWRNTLKTYAYPHMGRIPVKAIGIEHVLAVIEPIWLKKNETARRLRGRIAKILGWASARGYRSKDNPAAWTDFMETQLTKVSRLKRIKHHTALPVDDVPAFMGQLRERTEVAARALEFLALTATRTGEIRLATWQEIDFDHGVWSIPAERTKTKKPHRVPLSSRAIAILREMESLSEGFYVFPGRGEGKPLSDMAMLQLCRRMEANAVPHGFRSSFRDWCATKTNFPREVAERALAHVVKNKAEAAYFRDDLLEKRKALMQLWCDYCTRKPGSATVIELNGVRSEAHT